MNIARAVRLIAIINFVTFIRRIFSFNPTLKLNDKIISIISEINDIGGIR